MPNKNGWTALIWALANGHATSATQLIQAKANVNAANNDYGETALHHAANHGRTAVAELLLEAKADPTAVNKSGETPAQLAEQYGYPELAQRLHQAAASAAKK